MRYFFTILICAFFSVAMGNGRVLPFSESAKKLLATENLSSADLERLDVFASRMDVRRQSFKRTKNFVHYLNEQAHQEILLSYEQLSSFEELVSNGKYNCLTGSTFFALLLERYQIAYKVIETNYHMFILIEDEGRQYLLDATDPLQGFETNAATIEKRLSVYRAKNLENKNNTVAFQFDLFNQVKLSQLEGLLAYNHSVAAYNRQDFATAVDYLYTASMYYSSPRITGMAVLIENYLQGVPNQSGYLQKIAWIKHREAVLIARN